MSETFTSTAGIEGEKDGLFMAFQAGAYVIREPAFYAAALVVIGSAAFFLVIFPCLKAVDVKVPDISSYFIKLSNQFFVFGHDDSSL